MEHKIQLLVWLLGSGFLWAFCKWAMLPIIKSTVEYLLQLCEDTIEKIVRSKLKVEIKAATDAQQFLDVVKDLNITLQDIKEEMSEWRGALRQSGVLKLP